MRYKNYILFIVALSVLFHCSCSTSTTEDSSGESNIPTVSEKRVKRSDINMNISLLLDLSDRIDSTKYPNSAMQFYQRDLGYVNSVANAFQVHVKGKKIRAMNDQMQVYFEPAPLNPKINSIAQDLKIRINRENASTEMLEGISEKYSRLSSEIYQLARENNNYPGSNIWGFFSTKAKDYCIKEDSRNILVVITDGYIYHKDSKMIDGNRSSFMTPELVRDFGLDKSDFSNRFKSGNFGFISNTNGLEELNVLVLGLNPSTNNLYDEDLLRLYWATWLGEMGIRNFEIKTADLPSNLDELITDYILNKAV